MAVALRSIKRSNCLREILCTQRDLRWLLSAEGGPRTGTDIFPLFDAETLDEPIVWLGSCLYAAGEDIAANSEALLFAVGEVALEDREDGSLAWYLQRFPACIWVDRCGTHWESVDLLERYTLAQLAAPVRCALSATEAIPPAELKDSCGAILLSRSTAGDVAFNGPNGRTAGARVLPEPRRAGLDDLPAIPER